MKSQKIWFRPILLLFFIGTLAFTLFVGTYITGCQKQNENAQLPTIRLGLSRWPGNDIIFYAQEAGLFEKRGLKVDYVFFDVTQDIVRAMLQGNLDCILVPQWDVIQGDPGGETPEILMVVGVSYGSDGLVGRKEIKKMQDLKGKKVSALLGTVNHLILLEAMKLHNLDPKDIEIENLPTDIAIDKIKEGLIDGATMWQPLLSETAEKIEGNILFTTKDVDSMIIDILASRSSYVAQHEEELTKFILTWFDLMHVLENNPNEVFRVVGQKWDQTAESFAQDYAGLKNGDIEINKRMFKSEGRLEEVNRRIDELLEQDQRHSRRIRQDLIINSELVNKAIDTWKPLN